MTAPAPLGLTARCSSCNRLTDHPLTWRNATVCGWCYGELEAEDRETARRNIEQDLIRHRRRYEEP